MKRKEVKKEQNKKNKKESELVTKESLCAVCALFSVIAILILCTRSLIFGELGIGVHSFLTGIMGYFAYPALFCALYASVTALIGKRLIKNRKAVLCVALSLLCAAFVVHTAVTWEWFSAEEYLKKCYYAGESFPAATPTGWLGGLIVFAVASITSPIGSVIVFSALTLFFAYLVVILLKKRATEGEKPQTAEKPAQADAPEDLAWIQTPAQATVQPQPQISQAPHVLPPQQPQPQVSPAGYDVNHGVNIMQRPMVSLTEEAVAKETTPQSVGGAFSPFGTPQTMRAPDETPQYSNSREFLFGATPAENYQRNLIFDPNARVNQRPPVEPTAQPTVSSGYTPSYTAAYEDTVNGNAALNRPVKVVNDRVDDFSSRLYEQEQQEKREDLYGLDLEPMRPVEEPRVIPQETVEYPDPAESVGTPLRGFEEPSETVRGEERERGEETWNDYKGLFSPANPNVFGSESNDRALAEDVFSRGRNDEPLEDFSSERRRGEEEELFADPIEEELPPTRRGNDPEYDDTENERLGRNFFDEDEEEELDDPYVLKDDFSDRSRGGFEAVSRRGEAFEAKDEPTPIPSASPKVETPPPPPKPRVIRPYVRVPLDDFDCRDIEPTANFEEIEETKSNIIATLEDFNVSGATIASVTNGPTVARYNVTLPRSIPPKKVVALDQSIALSLHSSGVNIYPNFEDGVVSIEVPNKERQFVQLGCMLSADTFVNAKPSSLMFAMGKDVGNRKVYGDISKMIHLLVAGSSGSGKSVFLGSLIVSMIYKYSPEELRLILIDPKKTEFVLYNNLPHLMINEIITDVNKAVQSLNWAIGEMNRRYGLFEQMSRAGTYVVNLDGYNAHVEKKEDKLPKIVIIIDELADLMLAAKKEIEDRIQNLTQKARAAGIHLIVATQRPSTDVITGVIKSNLATRIAFAVATDVDSRVILDQSGAQNLLGKGDFLYTMQGINTPVRVQSAFISSEDSQRVVNFIKANNEAYYDETATAFINNTRGEGGGDGFGCGDEVEGVYIEALRHVILSGSASISMIQRKCSVGYNKAGKIVEWMEDMGYISSFDGAKARKVLITKEEFESKYGAL